MEKIYGRTKTIQEDKVSGFCPGCMHSTVIKLIGEVLEEMDLVDRAACVVGYCVKKSGGAAYTLAYARRQGRRIILLSEAADQLEMDL